MPDVVIENPILNSPFEGPQWHFNRICERVSLLRKGGHAGTLTLRLADFSRIGLD